MVVTVVTMRVMEVTINQVIYVISMGNSLMTTTRSVHMASFMTTARMPAGAIGRVGL